MKTFTGILIFFLIFLTGCESECNAQAKLRLVKRFKKTGIAYGLSVDKGYAYITNNDGLVIVDIHEPRKPRIVTRLNIGEGFSVFVKDDIAYVLAGKGFVIFDVKNPKKPVKLDEIAISGYIKHIEIIGSFAYIGCEGGMKIYDVSKPCEIEYVGHYGDSRFHGIEFVGNIVYAANYKNGVEVLDVSVPSSPQRITTIDKTDCALNVHINDQFLFVARHTEGITILDISNQESPSFVGEFKDDDGGEATGVYNDGQLLFVQDYSSLELIDISEPSTPLEIIDENRGGGHVMVVDGDYVYVTGKGLLVFELIND